MITVLWEEILGILLEKGIIDAQKRDEVKADFGKSASTDLEGVLIKKGWAAREDILSAMSEALDMVPVKASSIRVDKAILRSIPQRVAESALVLPISLVGKHLTVAMADPTNIFALDDIRVLTKMKVIPVIATAEDIRQAISNNYEESFDSQISQIVDEASSDVVELLEEEQEDSSDTDLIRITEQTPVVRLLNMILKNAVGERASDILIESLEETSMVRFRIDGMLHQRYLPPKKFHKAVISRIKVLAELDIAERRLPQDGRFMVNFEGRRVDFRVSIVPSSFGERAALRILDKQQASTDIDCLGFWDDDNRKIKKASRKPHGMIMMCGPTGCGKTTTLYSILRYIDSPELNLVTVEDPIEYDLGSVNQVAIRPSVGLTFESSLRSMLRQDPDVIMVGEIRTLETLDVAIKAALTGHLVLSTLHTNTAAGAVTRMVNMGIEPFLISSSTELVAAQRLLRRLCLECREAYTPEKELAEDYGIFDEQGNIPQIYKAVGCEYCRNTGYNGRVGILEVIQMSPAIKELVLEGAETTDIEKKAREEGMTSLRENGIRNVVAGIASLEDVLRVTMGHRKG